LIFGAARGPLRGRYRFVFDNGTKTVMGSPLPDLGGQGEVVSMDRQYDIGQFVTIP
jgi:hypothetical protein